MDFRQVLSLLLNEFKEHNIRYALIGGFALGALGVPRATLNIDFLIHRDDLTKIENIMKTNGYDCVFKSENVSQYVSPLKLFGEVDFLHAFRDISVGMLKRAIEKGIFEGKLKIRVLRPEDIIGLKLQAIANDEDRMTREYSDIEALMGFYRSNLDWELVEQYFRIFNQENKFLELKKRFYEIK